LPRPVRNVGRGLFVKANASVITVWTGDVASKATR